MYRVMDRARYNRNFAFDSGWGRIITILRFFSISLVEYGGGSEDQNFMPDINNHKR